MTLSSDAWAAGALSIFSVTAMAVLGSQYTQQSVQSAWYRAVRPTFAPPNWVFPLVWTLLYISLAAAFTLSMLGDSSIVVLLHGLNLALNVAWCKTFFGDRNLAAALGILVGNVGIAVAIAAITKLPTVRTLMIPYIAWLVFATALNTVALLRV